MTLKDDDGEKKEELNFQNRGKEKKEKLKAACGSKPRGDRNGGSDHAAADAAFTSVWFGAKFFES